MKLGLSHHLIMFFALFALLGQGLVTNGYAMVASPMNQTSAAEHSKSADSQQASTMDCHQQAPSADIAPENINKSKHCCDSASDMAQSEHASCCDSDTGCSFDCSHCMKISMTGHLQSIDIEIAKSLNIKAEATSLPHFFFHQTLPAFKPPKS